MFIVLKACSKNSPQRFNCCSLCCSSPSFYFYLASFAFSFCCMAHHAPSRSKQKIAQLKAKNTAKAIFRTCLNAYFRFSKRALPHWPISYCATMCTWHGVFFHGVARRWGKFRKKSVIFQAFNNISYHIWRKRTANFGIQPTSQLVNSPTRLPITFCPLFSTFFNIMSAFLSTNLQPGRK